MGRPAASVGAAAGRVSVWRRDSGARHGFTVAKRIPATRVRVVWWLRPLSVLCERRASVHYFAELHQRCLPSLPWTLTGWMGFGFRTGLFCELVTYNISDVTRDLQK